MSRPNLKPGLKIEEYVRLSLPLAVASSYDAIWRDLNSKLRAENCNFLQAVILIAIFFEPEGLITPSRLSAVLRTTRANVSHCLSHLEKRRLIQRTMSLEDARSYRLRLRPEGHTLGLRLIRILDELETLFEEKMGREGLRDAVGRFQAIESVYRQSRSGGRAVS